MNACPTGGSFNSTSSFPTLLKTDVNYTLNVSNCAASGSSGVTFTLTATANDTFNNTGAGKPWHWPALALLLINIAQRQVPISARNA